MERAVILFYPRTFAYRQCNPPYSLLFLAANLLQHGIHCILIDERIEVDPDIAVLKAIDAGAVCLGVSAMTGPQLTGAIRVSALVKTRHPQLPIVWGGWHPSLHPSQVLSQPYVDYVVRGQGQETLCELVQKLINNEAALKVLGLSYRNEGRVTSNPDCGLVSLLDFPPIPFGLIDLSAHLFTSVDFQLRRSIGYVSSQGCPYSCQFCSIGAVYHQTWLPMAPERVSRELKQLQESHGLEAVYFGDDNFLVNTQRLERFCRSLLDHDCRILWSVYGCANDVLRIPDRLWTLAVETGLRKITMGLETGSERVSQLLRKKHTIQEGLEAVVRCERSGVIPHCSLMFGFPPNAKQDIDETIAFAEQIKRVSALAQTHGYAWLPYPGTPLFDLALKHGMEVPSTLEGWASYAPGEVRTPWIGHEEQAMILDWQKQAHSWLSSGNRREIPHLPMSSSASTSSSRADSADSVNREDQPC